MSTFLQVILTSSRHDPLRLQYGAMRVVITGASGFLGRAALTILRGFGFEAIGLRRSSPAAGYVRVENYAEAPAGDVLVHLAEPSDRSQAAQLGDKHVVQVRRCLHTLLDGRYKQVIYASSASVYASADALLQVGDPVQADNPYDRGKLACEALTLQARGIVLRFSNLYGFPQKYETVIGTILSQIRGSGPLVIRDPTPIRDFLWVEDAAEAIAEAARLLGPVILNVGTGHGTSIGDLARIALNLANQSERPVLATGTSIDPSKLVLDIGDTVARTRWRPRTDLKEGIRRLLALNPSGPGASRVAG